jgi:paired amphipathic helix protein Sin3a
VEDIPKPSTAQKPQVEFDQAITYVNKIKERFANDERVYKAFLEILNMYRKGHKTIYNVYDEVALLFRNHQDLLAEFTFFLPNSTAPSTGPPRRPAGGGQVGARRPAGGPYASAPKAAARRALPPLRRDDPKVQRELAFFDKVKQRLRSSEAYTDFLKCINLFAEDVITKQELVSLAHDLIGRHHDLVAGLNEFLIRCELGPEDPYSRAYQGRDRSRHANLQQKYISLPISELDVASWERTTPSYVMLPTNYPRLKATGRNDIGAAILNDEWVSVTSGSEDFNFKHYRKNQYEDFLFMAEDDHFELDMIIDQNSSAIKAIRPLIKQISELEGSAEEWVLPEGALRAFHYRAISRIYGDSGPQMISLLRQNPAVALPTILPRLIQKDEEWKQTKKEMMPQWQAIFKDNYNKSLDHRSFYFKQNEKKNLTSKILFNELKEIADRRRNERISVILSLAGQVDFATRVANPHLTFEYGDAEVHADTAHIFQMGIDNMLTADAAVKVRSLYHSFVELFFEIPCSCAEAEEARQKGVDSLACTAGTTPRAVRALKAAKSHREEGDAEVDATTTTMDNDNDNDNDEDNEEDTDAMDDTDDPLRMLEKAGSPRGRGRNRNEETTNDAADLGRTENPDNEEERDETEFLLCRPVAALVNCIDKSSVKEEESHQQCRIFYCNEPLFVLFRLHYILFERLKIARKCAETKAIEEANDKKQIHEQFIDMARDLIEGTLDASVYEDDCRALLGTGAYQLFTLDKLVQKLVRHFHSCLTEEISARLIDLYKYENARGTQSNIDGVYYANARIVLGDEPAIRFERRVSDGAVLVQYLEPERGEPAIMLEPGFKAYVDEYVDGERALEPGVMVEQVSSRAQPGVMVDDLNVSETDVNPSRSSQVCLRRALNSAVMRWFSNVTDADDVDDESWRSAAVDAACKNAVMINGLECKLGSSAQQRVKKIAYVLGTEDYFARVGGQKRNDADSRKKRSERDSHFGAWVESEYERGVQDGGIAVLDSQAEVVA